MASDEHIGKQFIHLTPESIAEMQSAASAGQHHAEMQRHAQQTPANLSNDADLHHHLTTAHLWEDHDFYRNSHWRDIDHVVRESDLDRPLKPLELRRVHDDEHESGQAPAPGVSLGDDHFHE